MTIRLLHVADCHLGSPLSYLGDLAAIRRQDLFDTFSRICDVALEQRVAALLIAGDLFDSYHPPAATVSGVSRELERVTAAGIRVFVVPGDHDSIWYGRSVWRRSRFPRVHVFRAPTFDQPLSFTVEDTQCTVHGIAYSRTLTPYPLPTLRRVGEGIHVALMHATVDPPPGLADEQRYFPVTGREIMQTGMDFVALGHIHHRAAYVDDDRITAVYPGTPEGLDPSETGTRYAALVELDGGRRTVSFIPVNRREVRRVRMDVTDYDADEISAAIQESWGDDVLLTARLVGRPRDLLDLARIRGQLAPSFFWLALEDSTEIALSRIAEKLAMEGTVGGRFARALRDRLLAAGEQNERETLDLALKLGLISLRRRSSP